MGFSHLSDFFPNMRTVYVRFDGTPNKQYAYLYNGRIPLKQGDLVVVPVKASFAVATVVSTIPGMTDMAQRLIYCYIGKVFHQQKEEGLLEVFNRVDALKKKSEITCNVSCLNESYF